MQILLNNILNLSSTEVDVSVASKAIVKMMDKYKPLFGHLVIRCKKQNVEKTKTLKNIVYTEVRMLLQ